MCQVPTECPASIILFNPTDGHYRPYHTAEETRAQRAELRVVLTLSEFLRDDVLGRRPPGGGGWLSCPLEPTEGLTQQVLRNGG